MRAGVTALAYLLAAELGHQLSFDAIPFASFWPASGVLLAALVLSPRQWWPLMILWAMAANHFSNVVLHGQNAYLSLFFLLANAGESLCAALLVRFVTRGRSRINSLTSMPAIVGAGVLCPMVGATIGALGLALLTDSQTLLHNWRIWWIADVIGILITAPLVMIWAAPPERHGPSLSRWRIFEACALGALLLWQAEYVFNGRHFLYLTDVQLRSRFPIVLLPILAWIAIRFELKGVTLANAIVALIAVYCTSRGYGPFAVVSEEVLGRALILQGFLFITTFIALTFGAGITERRRSEQRERRLSAKLAQERGALREQKELLQAILNSIDDGVVVADKHFRLLQLNPAAQRMHGHALEDVPPEGWSERYGIFQRDGETPFPYEQLPLVRVLTGEAFVSEVEAVIKHANCLAGIVVRSLASPVKNARGEMVGAVVVMHDVTQQARADEERQRLIAELQQALREIKTLRGLIPICASCKSVRDISGYWQKLEAFLMEHADVEFSHGICNDCGEKLYGELWKQSQADNKVA